MIGRTLSHYKVLDKIGRGGMGEVYLAEDTKLGRQVAIKMLPDELAHDADLFTRFEREARVLASLNHPGIATLHGLEQSEDVRFIVMELVRGDTLEERIRKGALEIEEVLPLFLQIAEALEAAHGKGVIHRDLKPPNIKITPDGRTKILDFGLAKTHVEEFSGSNTSESPTLTQHTQAGVILGTVPYMSPEQARGKPVDKRTDIRAFGCVLFEALVGQRAFDGDSIADVMGAIVKSEPNWELLPKETPRRIRELLHRCLEKDIRRRLRDSGEAWFAIDQALTELLDSSTGDEVTEDTKELTPRPFVVTAAVTALITGLTVWALTGSDISTPVTRSVIPLAPADELHFDRGSVAISADGRQIVYVGRDSSGTKQLYLRTLDQLEGKPLDSTEGARVPFFSPDGRWVVYYDEVDQTLMKVSVSGGAPIKVAVADDYRGAREYRGASWGRDGWIVMDSISAGLLRIHEDGGTPEILTHPNREEREKAHRLPQILRGAKRFCSRSGPATTSLGTIRQLPCSRFPPATIALCWKAA